MKIAELNIGDACNLTMVVKSATIRETKTKKPYLAIELFDGTDTISGNVWDWYNDAPAVNSIVDVVGSVGEWQGTKQLTIKSLTNNTTRHLAEFAPVSNANLSLLYMDAYATIDSIRDDTLRNLGLSMLEELQDLWLTVPGAVGVHHAYIGGTLVHSLQVAHLAGALAELIPEANIDLCIMGGMFHDIGKLYTYKLNGIAIEITDQGKLYDHSFIGAEFVSNFADAHIDSDDIDNYRKIQLLKHIILSHHGQLEFGAAVPPQCIEAHIVSHADALDATVEQIKNAAKKIDSEHKWTDRIYTLSNKSQLTPAYIEHVMGPNQYEDTDA